jgi:SAM-dependent methyltransferase
MSRGRAVGPKRSLRQTLGRKARILRLAAALGDDPVPFYRETAAFTVEYLLAMGVPLRGKRWLDAGTGVGAMPELLHRQGARAVGLDLEDGRAATWADRPLVLGRAERLPFPGSTFDGVISSNVLEHAADPDGMLAEIGRVVKPGGFAYVSWTNWLSPWGGHEMSPFHYLGPSLGLRTYRAIHRRDPPENVPGRTLFVRHVGSTIAALNRGDLDILDVVPRYWPSFRAVARVPGLREVAMWNCVVLLRKPHGGGPAAA